MMKAKRKNNKGFTLVEMIIVIAVMAILGVVATPQFIKYVEESRRGTDRQAIWEVAHAAQIAYVSSEDLQGADGTEDNIVMVSIDGEGNAKYGEVSLSGDALDVNGFMNNPNYSFIFNNTSLGVFSNTKLDAEVNDVISADSYQYKSDLYRNSDIRIKINDDGTMDIVAGTINDVLNGIHRVDQSVLSGLKADAARKKATFDGLDAAANSAEDLASYDIQYQKALEAQTAAQNRYDNASAWDRLTAKIALDLAKLNVKNFPTYFETIRGPLERAAEAARGLADIRYSEYETANTKATEFEEKYNKDAADLTAKTENTDDLNTHINELFD